ncbi:hypothetical protein PGT21_007546 [Puccinia graminis f. sp. tritici]|uniref:Uncharacterized protein n=1 Tax=Puccinia graminis f. sp. tritici TaxID=56615 RepID=A0A5B0QLV3_PUCGR|nr:hypothetical protein PGT21_007546 [Puccinia graminis f. sp. tritici]KAA1113975.1 hypothetical protein PGTUg99_024718 [Puccinia graminis f. sp. tritici]KAA1137717.1 hypothetical protein PGTUg99_004496 [Puccinia graminis f. sp. tritici]
MAHWSIRRLCLLHARIGSLASGTWYLWKLFFSLTVVYQSSRSSAFQAIFSTINHLTIEYIHCGSQEPVIWYQYQWCDGQRQWHFPVRVLDPKPHLHCTTPRIQADIQVLVFIFFQCTISNRNHPNPAGD